MTIVFGHHKDIIIMLKDWNLLQEFKLEIEMLIVTMCFRVQMLLC